MPSKSPLTPTAVTEQLIALGELIRARRKVLKVSSTALAEAAGMSRVSVHRIERGEASVTMGAYLNVLAALGMTLTEQAPEDLAVSRDLAKAIARLQERTDWLERCMQAMAMTLTKAQLWSYIRALRRVLA